MEDQPTRVADRRRTGHDDLRADRAGLEVLDLDQRANRGLRRLDDGLRDRERGPLQPGDEARCRQHGQVAATERGCGVCLGDRVLERGRHHVWQSMAAAGVPNRRGAVDARG